MIDLGCGAWEDIGGWSGSEEGVDCFHNAFYWVLVWGVKIFMVKE